MKRPAFAGLLFAAVFYGMSHTPSLLPRHWLFQALVSGVVTAIGYAAGVLASFLWRNFRWQEPAAKWKPYAWFALACAGPTFAVVMTVQGVRWQLRLHQVMNVAPPWRPGYALGAMVAVLIAVALVACARGFRLAAHWIGHHLHRVVRRLPPRAGRIIGGVLVTLLVVGTLDGVVVDTLYAAADESFRLADQLIDDVPVPPMLPTRSGSAESLVRFEDLGWHGRVFVTQDANQLRTSGDPPLEHEQIRVFVGLESAASVAERAELVAAELHRTGAFDRSVLAVFTTTGTGWINPIAASSIELMWDGDTAIASYQYSYLPSWLSFLVDSGRAREAGAELFNAIHRHWVELPEDERPKLVIYGESLGADGAEAAFSGIADIRNRTNGVLLVGPPYFSELWSTFTQRRDPRTPEVLPIYDGGATVRFASESDDLREPVAPWYEPRVIYLQHPSDPVVWWSPRLILRRPDWFREPRADDVLASMRWFPFVTFWQLTADSIHASSAPAGHGHNYGTLVLDAWAAIVAPDGWVPADTERVRALVDPLVRRG